MSTSEKKAIKSQKQIWVNWCTRWADMLQGIAPSESDNALEWAYWIENVATPSQLKQQYQEWSAWLRKHNQTIDKPTVLAGNQLRLV